MEKNFLVISYNQLNDDIYEIITAQIGGLKFLVYV
jgi:hypothetical protein